MHAVELAAELERDHGVELNLDDVFADARPVGWPGVGHRPRPRAG